MNIKKAFTLVELLVVIAIISVLAAMLLPSIQNAMESARKTDCQNRMRQLMVVSHEYENMFGVILPPLMGFAQWGTLQPGSNLLWDAGLLESNLVVPAESYYSAVPTAQVKKVIPTLRAQSIFMCPSGYYGGRLSGTKQLMYRNGNDNVDKIPNYRLIRDNITQWGEDRSRIFPSWNPQLIGGYCQGEYPSWNPVPERTEMMLWGTPVSYHMNQALATLYNKDMVQIGGNSWVNLDTTYKPLRSYAGAPSKKLFFMEAYWRYVGVGAPHANYWKARNTSTAANWVWEIWQLRHLSSMNYSCHDGHVSSVSGDVETGKFYGYSAGNPGNAKMEEFFF